MQYVRRERGGGCEDCKKRKTGRERRGGEKTDRKDRRRRADEGKKVIFP